MDVTLAAQGVATHGHVSGLDQANGPLGESYSRTCAHGRMSSVTTASSTEDDDLADIGGARLGEANRRCEEGTRKDQRAGVRAHESKRDGRVEHLPPSAGSHHQPLGE